MALIWAHLHVLSKALYTQLVKAPEFCKVELNNAKVSTRILYHLVSHLSLVYSEVLSFSYTSICNETVPHEL